MYDDSCFKYQKIFSDVNSPLKSLQVKLTILQVNFFTCAVSINLRTIYKISIIRIFVAAGGKAIFSFKDGIVMFLYYWYF